MSSYVAIANLAAIKIGAEARITSPDDDRFVARTIKAVWDIERQATIRDGAWNFAARRGTLAAEALPGVAPYPWAFSFPLPAECLRLIEVLNAASREDYQLEGQSILSNSAGPLYVRYLVDVTEPALWDALFAEAFACRLAWKIGKRIAGSNYSEAQGQQDYTAATMAAKRVDARENPPLDQDAGDWITSRTMGQSSYGSAW